MKHRNRNRKLSNAGELKQRGVDIDRLQMQVDYLSLELLGTGHPSRDRPITTGRAYNRRSNTNMYKPNLPKKRKEFRP